MKELIFSPFAIILFQVFSQSIHLVCKLFYHHQIYSFDKLTPELGQCNLDILAAPKTLHGLLIYLPLLIYLQSCYPARSASSSHYYQRVSFWLFYNYWISWQILWLFYSDCHSTPRFSLRSKLYQFYFLHLLHVFNITQLSFTTNLYLFATLLPIFDLKLIHLPEFLTIGHASRNHFDSRVRSNYSIWHNQQRINYRNATPLDFHFYLF